MAEIYTRMKRPFFLSLNIGASRFSLMRGSLSAVSFLVKKIGIKIQSHKSFLAGTESILLWMQQQHPQSNNTKKRSPFFANAIFIWRESWLRSTRLSTGKPFWLTNHPIWEILLLFITILKGQFCIALYMKGNRNSINDRARGICDQLYFREIPTNHWPISAR